MATKATPKRATARAPKSKKSAAAPKRAAASTKRSTTRTTKLASPSAGPRRAIFIDVENTSSEADLTRVLEELAVDRTSLPTEVTAIGNWRVVGQQLGRALAQRGAHLVHSAPAARVPDWSDLWIAVQAGMWLGRARPGDLIEVVSHDRAFDAVGDAAARIGVGFRRITYRTAHASAERAETEVAEARRGRRRRRRGGRGRDAGAVAPRSAAPPRASHAAHTPRRPEEHAPDDERHSASRDHIRIALAQLSAADPERGVNLDALAVALKAAGFQRPPGSPRLVTRLRGLKDVEILPNGRVRLIGQVADVASAALATGEGEIPVIAEADASPDANGASEAPAEAAGGTARARRSRRRGGRRRGGRGRGKEKDAASPSPPPAE